MPNRVFFDIDPWISTLGYVRGRHRIRNLKNVKPGGQYPECQIKGLGVGVRVAAGSQGNPPASLPIHEAAQRFRRISAVLDGGDSRAQIHEFPECWPRQAMLCSSCLPVCSSGPT